MSSGWDDDDDYDDGDYDEYDDDAGDNEVVVPEPRPVSPFRARASANSATDTSTVAGTRGENPTAVLREIADVLRQMIETNAAVLRGQAYLIGQQRTLCDQVVSALGSAQDIADGMWDDIDDLEFGIYAEWN